MPEHSEAFNANVDWLKRVVPDDEIHNLTQQMIMTAEFFLDRWMEWVDVEEELDKNPYMKPYVMGLVRIKMLSQFDSPVMLKNYLKNKGFS
jgi:hypothetical protein